MYNGCFNVTFCLNFSFFSTTRLHSYFNEDLILSLPEGTSFQDIKWIAIWCELVGVSNKITSLLASTLGVDCFPLPIVLIISLIIINLVINSGNVS